MPANQVSRVALCCRKSIQPVIAPIFLTVLVCSRWTAPAQDNVTIPKSRLEELEQKERELNRLKGDLDKTKDENARLKTQQEQAVSPTTVTNRLAPVKVHQAPLMSSLPGIKETDQVDAMDLAAHFRTDPTAADARYRGQKFILHGEIAGFEKPIFERDYRVLLKTGDQDTRVICSFYPAEKYNAIFTSDHGAQLTGMLGETRVPLFKVGQTVSFPAECKGCKNSVIKISGGEIQVTSK